MFNNGILFILGSGASVDSGLYTYRGNNSINGSIVTCRDSNEDHWLKNQWLIEKLKEVKPGETYSLIQNIIDKYKTSVTIMTQNIDGLVNIIKDAKIIELHGTVNESICDNCGNIEGIKYIHDEKKCSHCNSNLRPNIIRIGENLKVDFRSYIKKRKYDLVIIVGTTLQFPYLRWIIGRAKCNNQYTKVIHINPDENYNDPYDKDVMSFTNFCMITKKEKRVRRKETWICKDSSEGLKEILNL